MTRSILTYELRYWSKHYPIYIYGAVFFLIGFASMLIGGDLLNEKTAEPISQVLVNSPYALYVQVFGQLNVLILFLLPAIFGNSLSRDFSSGMYKLLYCYPIRKRQFLTAKFISASIVSVAIVSCLGLGLAIGEFIPGLNSSFLGEFNLLTYLQIYLLYTIPTVLFIGAIVFSTVALSRSNYSGYLVIILVIVFRMIIQATLRHPDYLFIASVLDPYALMTALYSTVEWTFVEKNTLFLPLSKVVLYNRLIWFIIGAACLSTGFKFFALSHDRMAWLRLRSRRRKALSPELKESTIESKRSLIERVSISYARRERLGSMFSLSLIYFRSIVLSKAFLILILGLGVLMFIFLGQVNPDLVTSRRPFTQVMLFIPMIFYGFVLQLVTFIYAGLLTHRAGSTGMDQLIDSTASSSWTLILSKVITLIMIQITLLSIIMVVGITIQTYLGFYQYDLGQYLFALYVIALIPLSLWTVISLLVHTLLPNQYLGVFVLILFMFGTSALESFGISNMLMRFNEFPRLIHSDMNCYGMELTSFFAYAGYWSLLASILLVLTFLFWNRGVRLRAKDRIQEAWLRFDNPLKALTSVLLLFFMCVGLWIHGQTSSAGPELSPLELRSHKASVEKQLSAYFDVPHPRLTSVFVAMDIYPEALNYSAYGKLTYVNRSEAELKVLWLGGASEQMRSFDLNKAYALLFADSILDFSLLELKIPLAIGDSVQLSFELEGGKNTVLKSTTGVVENGTFIMPDMPYLGAPDFTLTDSLQRASHGLNPIPNGPRMPSDSLNLDRSYVHADFLSYETIVSTSVGQLAFGQGALQDEWIENDRHYFHYKNKEKVRNGFIYQSGRFELLSEEHKGVRLDIFHHPGHTHNLESMMNGMKATLDFCEDRYGPYQFGHMRIVEFPQTYGEFAQSFANTIAYSEAGGFMSNIDTSASVTWDSPFRLTAHEMSHQWWGHQVLPADALGSKFVTEGTADYIAARVMKEINGAARMQNIINVARLGYLRSRREVTVEHPLALVPSDQVFVAYQKGCLALNALGNYLGEDVLDTAMGSYFEAVKFQGPPYTTSLEFIDYLTEATPDSLAYLLDDYTADVILYDNYIVDAKYEFTQDSGYEVTLDLVVSKYSNKHRSKKVFMNGNKESSKRAEVNGTMVESLPLKDYVYVAVYGVPDTNDRPELIHYKAYRFDEIRSTLRIPLNRRPSSVHIDPKSLLLELDIDNNRAAL